MFYDTSDFILKEELPKLISQHKNQSHKEGFISLYDIFLPLYFHVLLGDCDLLPAFSDHGGVSLNVHNLSY